MSLPELVHALQDAVCVNIPEDKLAVAFSGGVDSAVLAVLCRDLGKQVTLVTVGFPNSHDISFSKVIAQKICLPQKIVELDKGDFQRDLVYIMRKVTCGNTSHIENCIAYYYIARAVRDSGLSLVASANGCDELFCGYNGYRAVYDKGESAIIDYMDLKIKNELVLVQEISDVASEFSVHVRQPFLSSAFIAFARDRIPVNQKIRGHDDMMRKHILRQAALYLQVPEESALKPKKALQYGSLIHKHYKMRDARNKKEKPSTLWR
jgi:asparagine synthase (glutamine-hydrolysing)